MDIKEAIAWTRNIPKIHLYIGTKKEHKGEILFTNGVKDCTEKEYYKDIDSIISLLQRGDNYRQMWEDLSGKYGFYPTYSVNKNTISEFMKELEQKYFPKEAKSDGS